MPCPQTRALFQRSGIMLSNSGDAPCAGAARGTGRHGRWSTSWQNAGSPSPGYPIPGRLNASASNTRGGSRMRECRTYGSVRGARSNARPLYVAAHSVNTDISPSSKESGEPHSSLGSTNLCGRYGPAFPKLRCSGRTVSRDAACSLIPRTRWPDAEPCRARTL